MTTRVGYIPEFLDFWSANDATEKIWMSIFTPQRGATNVECLTADQRRNVVELLLRIRQDYPKLDMPEAVLNEYLSPPASPQQCIFAKTTRTISADFQTQVKPCQFGGDPDCSQCGCIASMGLAAIGHRKVLGPLTAGHLFWASASIGQCVSYVERTALHIIRR